MFEENENLALEDENAVEQPAEEVVDEVLDNEVDNNETTEEKTDDDSKKLYTEEEMNQRVDELLAKKIARKTNQIEREYRKKYSKLENVLNAGLGTKTVEDATEQLTEFYTNKGITIPNEPSYSERETEVLANAEANEIISLGYDEIKEETDRLAGIGVDNMSNRDKIIFQKLASERTKIEQEKELASIGIDKTKLEDEEFKDFRKKLNSDLSLKEQYEMFLKFKPKKEVKKMGSMKQGATAKVKDYYSPEEIDRLTDEDLDDPKVWEAVRKSMTGRA